MKRAFLLAGFVLALNSVPVLCDSGGGWPKSFSSDGASLTVYQPQVTGWSGNTLTARMAVSVLPQGAAAPQFGTLVLTGTADVDNELQTVSLSNIAPVQVSFPSAPDKASNYAGLVCGQAIGWAQNLSLPAIRANLAVTKAEGAPTVAVQNPVPAIFFSESSAVLVLVNGEPALRPVAGTSLLRAINTQAVLVMDQSSGVYYLRVSGGWSQAPALAGPWTAAQNPPATLSTVLQNISSTAELFNPPAGLKPGPTPAIFVSTGPAELITTQGTPQFAPITGTGLLKVTNSGSSIFVYEPNQNYYVVISGRWFASPSLSGPWQFVPSAQLPADFAKIPESDPAGAVLASVAGTPQAGEAAISSTIPQTATVARTATTTVSYAGDPVFQPVGGTALSYATNTATPVIKVAEDAFYSVVNGVWFFANAALGPWTVAPSVPDAIYTISPSCPVYYATNVHVYGSTPDVVYTGYTPGYFGPCLSPEGVVVYGTGFWYPPFIGPDAWIGPPLTYGFGAGFACGLATGFAFGLAADHGWGCSPWWGPWHGGWGNSVTVNRNWNNVNVNAHNVYNRWPDNVVKNQGNTFNRTNVDNTVRNDANTFRANNDVKSDADKVRSNPDYQSWKSNADNRVKDDSSRLGDNNVFAGKDGNAYRSTNDGNWEKRDGDRWSKPEASSFDSGMHSDLDSQHFSRSVGGTRSFGGGGMRGGFRR
ncbi:MAG: hypothetical protein D4R65_14310 [Verrucomicrobiaceae bacterium]|nr:MAG: hypothetical protein D4R65_14310 [Verrucomicrobiaceae bacterium]